MPDTHRRRERNGHLVATPTDPEPVGGVVANVNPPIPLDKYERYAALFECLAAVTHDYSHRDYVQSVMGEQVSIQWCREVLRYLVRAVPANRSLEAELAIRDELAQLHASFAYIEGRHLNDTSAG